MDCVANFPDWMQSDKPELLDDFAAQCAGCTDKKVGGLLQHGDHHHHHQLCAEALGN
jgi:hypothetical protein